MIPFSFLSSISGVLLLLCSVVFLKYSTDRMGHSSDVVPTSAFKLFSLATFSVLGFIACVGVMADLFIICHDGLKEWMKAYIPTCPWPSAIQIILLPWECWIILMQDSFRRCLTKYCQFLLCHTSFTSHHALCNPHYVMCAKSHGLGQAVSGGFGLAQFSRKPKPPQAKPGQNITILGPCDYYVSCGIIVGACVWDFIRPSAHTYTPSVVMILLSHHRLITVQIFLPSLINDRPHGKHAIQLYAPW